MSETREERWREEHGYFFRGSPTDPQWLELDYLTALEQERDELRKKAALCDWMAAEDNDYDPVVFRSVFREFMRRYDSLIQEGK